MDPNTSRFVEVLDGLAKVANHPMLWAIVAMIVAWALYDSFAKRVSKLEARLDRRDGEIEKLQNQISSMQKLIVGMQDQLDGRGKEMYTALMEFLASNVKWLKRFVRQVASEQDGVVLPEYTPHPDDSDYSSGNKDAVHKDNPPEPPTRRATSQVLESVLKQLQAPPDQRIIPTDRIQL